MFMTATRAIFPPKKDAMRRAISPPLVRELVHTFLWGATSITVQLISNLTGLNLVPFLMLKLRALSFLVEFNQSDGIYRALIGYRNLVVSS